MPTLHTQHMANAVHCSFHSVCIAFQGDRLVGTVVMKRQCKVLLGKCNQALCSKEHFSKKIEENENIFII